MPKYNFTESEISIRNGKAHLFESNELNISFMEDSDYCGFSFDLELVDIDEAKSQIREFKTYLPYDELIEYRDNPLDYNVGCKFSNYPTTEDVLNAIYACFIQ